MSITEEQYKWLAEQSYWVEKVRDDVDYHPEKGKKYFFNGKDNRLGQFQVLAAEDNTANGMQAMAVAPVDKDGNVDNSQVVIAYAGTNFSDEHDRDTDVQSIIAGGNYQLSTDSKLVTIPGTTAKVLVDETRTTNQLDTAMDFAKKVKEKYPHATLSFTGHSLGGYLAMRTAAETHHMATTFNAPSAVNNLSTQAKNYVKKNRGLYANYRIKGDYIGNLGVYFQQDDELGVSRWVSGSDTGNIGGFVYYHGLDRYRFNKSGQLVDSNGLPVNATATIVSTVVSSTSNFKTTKSHLEKTNGKLSDNEEFFLDSTQATVIATGLVKAAETVKEEVEAAKKHAVEEAEELYQSTKTAPFGITELSVAEIQAAYAEAGVTYDSIVGKTERHFDKKVSKAKKLVTAYSDLQGKIQAGVNDAFAKDASLAGKFQEWSAN